MAQNSQPNGEPELNYFVCTLGQAATLNTQNPHVFKNVNDFLDHQARVIPRNPAVGFPIPPYPKDDDDAPWQHKIFSMNLHQTK